MTSRFLTQSNDCRLSRLRITLGVGFVLFAMGALPLHAQQQAGHQALSDQIGSASHPAITQVTNETVVVQVPLPKGLTKDKIRALFVGVAPDYLHVDGLLRKYFLLSEDKAGGVYLFTTRQKAEAWFSAAWHDSVRKTYGADAEVLMFETPVIVDNTGSETPIGFH